MTDWVGPLTMALKEEQHKCMKSQLNPSRQTYGDTLLKINPEKISTAALAQLIISIFQEIYKQGTIDMFDLQLFDGIDEKKYLSKVISSIETEISFEKEEQTFR